MDTSGLLEFTDVLRATMHAGDLAENYLWAEAIKAAEQEDKTCPADDDDDSVTFDSNEEMFNFFGLTYAE